MHKCLRDATQPIARSLLSCGVRLFVTLMYRNGQFYYQTFSSPGGPIILVFHYDCEIPTGSPSTGAPNRGGVYQKFATSISEIPIPIPNTEVFQNTDTEYRTDMKKIPTKIPNTDSDSNTDTDPALIQRGACLSKVSCRYLT